MNYIIGSGYHFSNHQSAEDQWYNQIMESLEWDVDIPIYVLSTGFDYSHLDGTNQIPLNHNLGHVSSFLSGEKQGLCGWAAHVLTLAMIAYSAGRSLVYIEQDVVFRGPLIETMFQELGDRKFIFGKKHTSAPGMDCGQSVFIIKWDFLLRFVSAYLSMGENETKDLLPEDRFVRIEKMYPDLCCRTLLGPERERPIDFDAPVWYAQQLTESELEEMKKRGLI